ncbi:MAG: fused MFS/spermidine synthase, partial [Acidimicrobiales bacterium]
DGCVPCSTAMTEDLHRSPAGIVKGGTLAAAGATALVFTCSAAVLVIEILAGRLLAPYVGVSLETYTGIIGTVLAGIAIGTALGGRLADRVDPRRLLGPTIVAGGALAVLSLPVVGLLGPAVAGGGPVAIVFLALTAFVLPTAVLSAVSPMVAKLRLASIAETGSVVGGLSAAGTAGALVGTFATGFVLVAALPSRPIVIGLGVLLAVLGVVLWIGLAGGLPGPAVAAAVLVVAGLGAASDSPCQRETAYYCASVEVDPDRPTGRVLVLDDLRHSYVDLEDPTYLEFRYIRLFAAVTDRVVDPGPIDVLHLGGGGFTFPRHLLATRPGTTNTVLELDPEIVAIGEEELGLEPGPDLRIRTGDARTNITEETTGAYDLVVGDAFGGLSVPWHLATVELVEEVARTLRPGGTYVVNAIDGGPRSFVRAELATFGQVFDHLAVVVPPAGRFGNHVLVASDEPIRLDPIDPVDGVLLTGEVLEDFIGDARSLRDDFAPVDQLITRE